jgi:aspartate racemase
LAARYGGEPVIPTADEQREIGRVILDELCHGVVTDASHRALLDVIAAHSEADAVILGCTELCLILTAEHTSLPVFDTTALHAEAGMAFAFGEEP